MYLYQRTEPQLWTVGYYDPAGNWVSESDHSTPAEAAARVAWLNGDQRDEIQRLQERVIDLEFDNATYKEWIAEHHYWVGYTCDACGLPFTLAEWDARETPHRVDCPNYDADTDEDGMMEFTECDCDRNYHSRCFSFSADPKLTT